MEAKSHPIQNETSKWTKPPLLGSESSFFRVFGDNWPGNTCRKINTWKFLPLNELHLGGLMVGHLFWEKIGRYAAMPQKWKQQPGTYIALEILGFRPIFKGEVFVLGSVHVGGWMRILGKGKDLARVVDRQKMWTQDMNVWYNSFRILRVRGVSRETGR